ncbi:PREDICTED: uncharacterized protein LOC105361982 [Ceratosolen solmsi marchali]|uniref:Uncharacterized protein LOC105361982 n=1 Tax=Ceratosolen solmsi marchali TaxID=326594 RepID=A0AAJ7DV70_9HYME|nr:PREDICTED: uncharacterized protein LOC105361982 [Ceratosolen solmsi marchali]
MDGGSTEDAGAGPFAGLGGLERWRTHSRIAAWCLVLCGSMLLNATLLVAFIRRPGLRTISNRFVMNLIASNLLAVIVLAALLIMESRGGATSLCGPSEGATALVTTSSILSVLLIGVDQYLAIVDPLRYRARIDKLRCGLLILASWLVALGFGAIASLNPQPRSLWRLCRPSDDEDDIGGDDEEASAELSVQESLVLDGNVTESADLEILGEISLRRASATYGRIYALTYALLGYLAPFLAIVWIYFSIYRAARNNSERTRRTGSRPVLSSGSFCEEAPPPPPAFLYPFDDSRRVPKISSLSSIDESVEANATSGLIESQASKVVETAQTVVFTVGVATHCHNEDGDAYEDADDNTKESTESTVPIIAPVPEEDFLAGSAEHQQESTYGRMMLGCEKHPYEYEDELEDSSEEEEEAVSKGNVERPLGPTAGAALSVNFDLEEKHREPSGPRPPIVTVTPPALRPTAPLHRLTSLKTGHSYIEHLRYRISNGSLFKYREETRAARISALVIVMGLICWTPYVCMLVLRNLVEPSEDSEDKPMDDIGPSLDAGALGFLVLATYVSPLLFGYRSRRVKRELRKFFCFKRELSYRNNRSLMAKKVLRRRHSGVTMLGQMGLGGDSTLDNTRYNILNCMYGRVKWPKDKVHFVQVPDTALAVETCRSSFSSGASTQISSTSTDEC